jgi:hypothetical protein
MVDVRLSGKPMAQRIADRLRNSGDGTNPDVHTQQGTSPRRVHHNIHNSWNAQTGVRNVGKRR